jgi:hypothetical protein
VDKIWVNVQKWGHYSTGLDIETKPHKNDENMMRMLKENEPEKGI